MSERNEAYLKAFRDYLSKPGMAERLRQEQADFEAYMALPEHEADCYCSRCMAEFATDSRRKT